MEVIIASWNVEGLTEAKTIQLQLYTELLGIGILCLRYKKHTVQLQYTMTLTTATYLFCPETGANQRTLGLDSLFPLACAGL